MRYLKSINEAAGVKNTVEVLSKLELGDFDSASTRDGRNADYDAQRDKRIVMYYFTRPDTDHEVWVTLSYALEWPESGEDKENDVRNYTVFLSDDVGDYYTYKGKEVSTSFKTWEEGYKYVSEILKKLGLKGKPEILKP